MQQDDDGLSQQRTAASKGNGVTRRIFLGGVGMAGIAVSTGSFQSLAAAEAPPPAAPPATAPPSAVALTLTVNGQEHHLQLEPRVTLLDALREQMHLFGTKKGCD